MQGAASCFVVLPCFQDKSMAMCHRGNVWILMRNRFFSARFQLPSALFMSFYVTFGRLLHSKTPPFATLFTAFCRCGNRLWRPRMRFLSVINTIQKMLKHRSRLHIFPQLVVSLCVSNTCACTRFPALFPPLPSFSAPLPFSVLNADTQCKHFPRNACMLAAAGPDGGARRV